MAGDQGQEAHVLTDDPKVLKEQARIEAGEDPVFTADGRPEQPDPGHNERPVDYEEQRFEHLRELAEAEEMNNHVTDVITRLIAPEGLSKNEVELEVQKGQIDILVKTVHALSDGTDNQFLSDTAIKLATAVKQPTYGYIKTGVGNLAKVFSLAHYLQTGEPVITPNGKEI